MILTDNQIREAQERGQITIEPFDEAQVQPATYDLRVGRSGATTSTKELVNLKEKGYLLIKPGDFAIVTIFEEIGLDAQHAARFGLRAKYARKGLIATTGPQIDPGYRGCLRIGLTNLTPHDVALPYKDDLVSVEFHRLEEPVAKPYSGQYQGQTDLLPEEIEAVTEGKGMAISEVIEAVSALSKNVGVLTQQVRTLLWMVPTMIAVTLAVLGVIVAVK